MPETKYEAISALITAFCKEKLDSDYTNLCLHALKKLDVSNGKPSMWAAGIVYAIAQNNYLTGNQYDLVCGRPKYHLTTDEVAEYFAVSKGGLFEKAKSIREKLRITVDKEEWMTPERRDNEGRKAMMLLRRMLKGI